MYFYQAFYEIFQSCTEDDCLTMGVAVVGVGHTTEALLSSCVPDLQRVREQG